MRWIAVVCLALSATAAAAEQRLVVGDAPGGVFYWNGHRITPPYHVEIGFEIAPDTQWTATYINGLPVDRAVAPTPPPIDWATPSLDSDQQALSILGWREVGRDHARGLPLAECLGLLADLLRSEPGLVDSVRVGPLGSSISIWWHGWYATPEEHFFMDSPPSPPQTAVERWRASLDRAGRWPLYLRGNAVVLSSGGGFSSYGGVATLDDEIRRFQAGDSTVHFSLRLGAGAMRELRAPRPMSQLLREMSYVPAAPPAHQPPPRPADVQRIVLEPIVDSGATVFIAGREAVAPFVLEGEFVADPDTTWLTLYLDGTTAWRRSEVYSASAAANGTAHWRPGVFRVTSFALRRGGLLFVQGDSVRVVPRLRREMDQAVVDSLRSIAAGRVLPAR